MSRSRNTTSAGDTRFRTMVLNHWRRHGRHDLPWRKTTEPYRILVSEIMLQQTQVDRVAPKYRAFLRRFPTFRALARASVGVVLKEWQGLGYNRRALMLHRCAQAVMDRHSGKLPADPAALRELPGIGPYTAGAVMAFSFDRAVPAIETNIRRVYLYHYFPRSRQVSDDRLLPLIIRHLDQTRSARRWYWALMDYGSHLAAAVPNPNRRSRQYTRQSKFEGSDRQLRGAIVRDALSGADISPRALVRRYARPLLQVRKVLAELSREGLLVV